MQNDKKYCVTCGSYLMEKEGFSQCTNSECLKKYYNNPIVGVSVVYMEGGKILLGKRGGSHKTGEWCIPCGYLENEDIKEGAIREFQEETSLIAKELQLLDVLSNWENPQPIVSVYYEATSVEGVMRAQDDLVEVRFFSLNELPEMAFEVDGTIIKKIKKGEMWNE